MISKLNNLLTLYWRMIQIELLFWARFPLEYKFTIAFALLVLSLILSGISPILGSVTNVWGLIVFFEALFQKKFKWEKWNGRDILITYAGAGIIGTLVASFLLLYFDALYFLKLSTFDLLTRYIWFLLPLSKIVPSLVAKTKSQLAKKSNIAKEKRL